MAGMQSTLVWLVDANDRTAINALSAAWESIKDPDQIIFVKNHRKGTDFSVFDESKTVQNIIKSPNVRTMNLPKIATRIEENLRIDRMTWKQIANETPIANRIEGQRIRNQMHDALQEVGL